MDQTPQFRQIIATYRKFEWTLKGVLLSAATARALAGSRQSLFGDAPITDHAPVDALWFARPSSGPAGREAWELRFVGAAQFALFETFEPDESEEERIEARREMERQLVERVQVGLPQLELGETDAAGDDDDEEGGDEDAGDEEASENSAESDRSAG